MKIILANTKKFHITLLVLMNINKKFITYLYNESSHYPYCSHQCHIKNHILMIFIVEFNKKIFILVIVAFICEF